VTPFQNLVDPESGATVSVQCGCSKEPSNGALADALKRFRGLHKQVRWHGWGVALGYVTCDGGYGCMGGGMYGVLHVFV
jgi:hypothetical protein